MCIQQQAPQVLLQGANREPQLNDIMKYAAHWYQTVFSFDVSDEEYQVVAQQVGVSSSPLASAFVLHLAGSCV